MAAEKVIEYKRLVEETLSPLVKQKEEELSKIQEELDDYQELQANLRDLARHRDAHRIDGKPFKLLTDVGQGFRMHARVAAEDTNTVYLHVGAGVYPELKLHEATAYVNAKVEALSRMRQQARDELVGVKTDLAVANAAIQALSRESNNEDGSER